MGYHTSFSGEFEVTPPLSKLHCRYLCQFSMSRHMTRNGKELPNTEDMPHRLVGFADPGVEGEFWVRNLFQDLSTGEEEDRLAVTNYNVPPADQPGLWCDWIPNEDGTAIIWDRAEKFYNYVEWMQYLIEKFLKPWGYSVNGRVLWYGEDPDDRGIIYIQDNQMEASNTEFVNTPPTWFTLKE